MDWTALVTQAPMIAAFIWFALEMNKRSQDQQRAFIEALDRRDQAYEKRNEAICDALEKQTAADRERTKRDAENRARAQVATAPSTPIAAVDLSKPKEYTRDEWLKVCADAERGDPSARQVLHDYDNPSRAKQKIVVKP